jgi:hypothetical protein
MRDCLGASVGDGREGERRKRYQAMKRIEMCYI